MPCSVYSFVSLAFASLALAGTLRAGIDTSRPLSIDDGLSQSTINCIVQDREGFMWFGTEDGLNRYDGYRFIVFKHNQDDSTTLSDNYVSSLFVDRSGTLWIGTMKGVEAWDPLHKTFKKALRDPQTGGPLRTAECRAICQDSAGTLWFGTASGLFRYDPLSGNTQAFRCSVHTAGLTAGDDFQALMVDASGTLWAAIRKTGMLSRFNPSTAAFTHFPVPGRHEVWAMQQETDGTLCVATYDGGLVAFDPRNGAFTPRTNPREPADKQTWTLYRDRTATIWVGTGGAGLVRLPHGTEQPERHLFTDNYILSLFEDRTGVLWIGTGKGIHRLDGKHRQFRNYSVRSSDERSDRDVWAIAKGFDGTVWVATNSGLKRTDETGNIIPEHVPVRGVTRSLCEDRNGTLWIGTMWDGLIAWDRRRRGIHTYSIAPLRGRTRTDDEVKVLFEARDGTLWIGTSHFGLCRLSMPGGQLKRYRAGTGTTGRISSDCVSAILQDHHGMLWIGTDGGGLNRFDPATEAVEVYRHNQGDPSSISNDRIYSICEDQAGHLWIGTALGLNVLDPSTGAFTRFLTEDGLPNDVVYGILEDGKGRLWLSTNKGISRFDPMRKEFRNYDGRDGLQSSEFNTGAFFKARDGEMFFGGINGITAFSPDAVTDNPYPPPVVFTDVRIFDKPVDPAHIASAGGVIELNYTENFFSVEFAALDFTCPEKNRYACRLEGFDHEWMDCGTRHYAAYTNLGAGEYILHVRGSNSDGAWNMEGATVRIRVTPPFWKSWWFLVLMGATAVLAGAVIVQRRFAMLKKRTLLQEQMSRRILQSQEDERKRIGTSLHDGLGQNLLMIKNLAVMGIEADRSATRADGYLTEISSLSSQALAEVREIAYNLRPYQLDRLGLTGALRSVVSRAASASNIAFSVDLDNVDSLFSKDQEINLFRIAQEAISNVVRHSGASRAAVQVQRGETGVAIIVTDDGRGFSHDGSGFGLSGMAERARILGGTLTVHSAPNEGTRVRALIPLEGSPR